MPSRTSPGPHPDPPPDLRRRRLPLKEFRRPWFRIFGLGHDPLYFGLSGQNRFDAPAREYGVLYVARDAFGAFIETFGRATDKRFITGNEVRERGLARIEASRPLRLVDLTGPGLAHLSADSRLCTGEIGVAQRWSLTLHEHVEQPDGIYYRARHDPERFSGALFERCRDALQVAEAIDLYAPRKRRQLLRILEHYQFGWKER